jgi:hypothetical protein
MEINDILNELFRMHDELSFDCVFNESESVRAKAFDKAEALRELVQRIEDGIEDVVILGMFKDVKLAHYKAQSAGLFYNRNVRLKV